MYYSDYELTDAEYNQICANENFVLKPYMHQASIFDRHKDDFYHAMFHEMGSGKTKINIDNAVHLYLAGKIDAVVVVTLNGVHRNWHRRELPKHMPPQIKYRSIAWQAYQPKYIQQEQQMMLKLKDKEFAWFCFNVEAFQGSLQAKKKPKALAYLREILKIYGNRVLAILDESDTIKDPDSNRTGNLILLGNFAKYKRILTGTPITESPFDVYCQTEFMQKGLLGYQNFHHFRNSHGVYKKVTLTSNKTIKVLDSYKALDVLRKKIYPIASEIAKEECLDLPAKVYQTIDVPLTDEQQKFYNQMKQIYMAWLNSQDIIEAENAMHRLRKLHECVLGFARDSDGVEHTLKHNRLEYLDMILNKARRKVVIFSECKPALLQVYDHLVRTRGHDRVVRYYGGISTDEKEDALDSFQDPNSSVRYFVGNQQTAGFGLDMTEADLMVYYSNGYSLRQRLQSEDRIHRATMDKNYPATYIDMVSPGTVEVKLRNALKAKVDVARQVTTLIREFFGD